MMFKMQLRLLVLWAIATTLPGCASFDFIKEKFNPKETISATPVAPQWRTELPPRSKVMTAQLPHDGKIENLQAFWAQYQDTLLLELIAAAEKESLDIATSKARISEARANRIAASAVLLPTLDGKFSASRSIQQPTIQYDTNQPQLSSFGSQQSSAVNSADISAQAAWELDVFGANRTLNNAAIAREHSAQAGWHDARVSVAAEVATSYFNQQFCQMQLLIDANDAKSRAETARISEISTKAGFTANADMQLAIASASESAQLAKAQQAQCDLGIKELVALTDMDEATLKTKLVNLPLEVNAENQSLFTISEIPAQVIAQRPDIFSAEVDLMTAAANIKDKQAQRLPKVSLNGSIGWMRLSGSGFTGNGTVWSLGPLSITLPLFDGGKRKANEEYAVAKYEEAAINYRSKVRYAVKEVEDALVTLHSTAMRQTDVERALNGYNASLKATETKVKAGFANQLELEENRRRALQAETNRINLLKERNNAWIALYRAAGGGWQNTDSTIGNEAKAKSTKSSN